MKRKVIRVYVDGSCWPNPGGRCAYGWVASKDGHFYQEGSGYIGEGPMMSNNVAEYEALYHALEWLKNNGYKNEIIECRGDSMLVVKQMNGEWKVKKGLYLESYKKAYCMFREFPKIKISWIPRIAMTALLVKKWETN